MTFEELYERNHQRLARHLATMFNPDDVADAMQEAWMVAIQKWDHVVTLDHPAAWVRSVALWRLRRDYAARRRRTEILSTIKPATVEPAAAVERVDFKRGMDRLSHQQRAAVCLVDIGGWTVTQTADHLGVSARTVSQRLDVARRHLRTHVVDPTTAPTDGEPAKNRTVGELLRDELAERGMTQVELADAIGRCESIVNDIISGRRNITPEVADRLGQALGTPAEMWSTPRRNDRCIPPNHWPNLHLTILRSIMTDQPTPDEPFPPGDYLRDELAERGMTQAELATRIGRAESVVNRIIAGRHNITPEVAIGLGAALDTSAELWVHLEAQYQLDSARQRLTVPVP